MKKILVCLCLLCLPLSALAAGFVEQPLFLSKSPVTEGQRVRVYAIVSNDSATAFSGVVNLSVDGAKLGSPAATLAVGATQTVSAFWTPTAGDHVVTANLTSDDGSVVETVSHTFSILALPQPVVPPDPSAGYTSSAAIQEAISHLSPTVSNILKPALDKVDNIRASINQALGTQLEKTNKSSAAASANLASSKAASSSAATVSGSIFRSAYTYLLTFLKFLIGNPIVFFPVFCLLFFYGSWKLFKKMSRRK